MEFASLMELGSSLINPPSMYTMALNRVISNFPVARQR